MSHPSERGMAAKFELVSKFTPAGDQPKAIEGIVSGFRQGKDAVVLLGSTGTGKSLAPDEPVLVRRRLDGVTRTSLEPIGSLIDAQMSQQPQTTCSETQIAAPPDG